MRFRKGAITGALALCVLSGAASAQQASKPSAEGGPSPAVARIQLTGTLKIQVSLTVSKSLPNGTTITVSPQALVQDDIYSNFSTTSASVKVSGGKASLTILLPYTWLVASKSDKLNLSVNVNGFVFADVGAISDNSFFNKTITVPANGKTTTLSFTGTI